MLDGDLDEFVEASLKSGLEAGSKRRPTLSTSVASRCVAGAGFGRDDPRRDARPLRRQPRPCTQRPQRHDRSDATPQPPTDENHLIAERRAKLAALREQGIAFPNDFRRRDYAGDLQAEYADAEQWTGEALEGDAAAASPSPAA